MKMTLRKMQVSCKWDLRIHLSDIHSILVKVYAYTHSQNSATRTSLCKIVGWDATLRLIPVLPR